MKQAYNFTTARWTWTTFGGWVTGVVLIILLSSALDAMGITDMQFYIGAGMGAGVGFMQWLQIRKFTAIGFAWFGFSLLGMTIPFVLTDLLYDSPSPLRLPVCTGLGAALVSLLQYTLLRTRFRRAWLWVPGCFAGWILAVLMVFAVDHTKKLPPVISSKVLLLALINLLLILGGGIVLGIVTGLTLRKTSRIPC